MPLTLAGNQITFNDGTTQDSGIIPASKIDYDGGSFSFRNKIINGNFDIWQRGTTYNSVAEFTYTADRWRREGSTGVVNITQQPFTIGQTEVPNNPTYYLRMSVVTGGIIRLTQPIENVTTLSGKTVTYSFWAKASVNTTLQDVSFAQYFGGGGTPSSITVTTGSIAAVIPTTWTKIIGTVNLPSVAGKFLGTDGFDHLNFRIVLSPAFTGNFDIAQVQIEEGPTATPFELKPIQAELNSCQRYYEKNYGLNVVPGTVFPLADQFIQGIWMEKGTATSDNIIGSSIPFMVQKRSVPAVRLWSYNGVLNRWRAQAIGGSDIECVAAVSNLSERGFRAGVTVTASGGWRISGFYDAEAEL